MNKTEKTYKYYLDIGCGIKSSLEIYKSPENVKVVGIDLDKTLIRKMKKLWPHAKFLKVDAQNLPFANNFFDKIFCLHLLEHVPDPERVMEEIFRVLKPSGNAYIAVPSPNYEKVMGFVIPGYHGTGWHLHVISKDIMIKMIYKAGLKIESLVSQRWFHAVGLTVSLTLSRYFGWPMNIKNKRFDSGETIITKITHIDKAWQRILGAIRFISRISDKMPIVRFVNEIYPFETYVVVSKRGVKNK
jgi:SAM-dependent methyltransferase